MFSRTARLFLRPGWTEDAPALAHALNDLEVSTKLGRVPHPYGQSDAEAFLSAQNPMGDMTCLVFRRGIAAELVGGISLMPIYGGVELGYWLARPHWGRGYATEAGRAMLLAARHTLGLKAITAQHSLDNPASGRVLRKLGFAPTGHVRQVSSLARGCDMPCAEYRIALGTHHMRDAPHPMAA